MEENKKMTVFYYKEDGSIYSIISEVTDFNAFGRKSEIYKIIMEFIIVDYDLYVIMNPSMFKVNEDKELKLVGDFSKYQ